VCKTCQKSFSQSSSLKKHKCIVESHPSELIDPLNLTPDNTHEATFAQKDSLAGHDWNGSRCSEGKKDTAEQSQQTSFKIEGKTFLKEIKEEPIY